MKGYEIKIKKMKELKKEMVRLQKGLEKAENSIVANKDKIYEKEICLNSLIFKLIDADLMIAKQNIAKKIKETSKEVERCARLIELRTKEIYDLKDSIYETQKAIIKMT